MAVRQATRRYPDLSAFLQDAQGTLAAGALMLPADQAGGDLAPEIKLDLMLPLVGRVGPINAQVVARMPDGSVALRLVEIPGSVHAGFQRVHDAIGEAQSWLVSSGAVVPAAEAAALQAEIAALRAERDALAQKLASPRVAEALAREAAAAPAPEPEAARQEIPEAHIPESPAERGPSRPDLAALPPSASGTLEEGSLRRAMVALALAHETGILQINTPDGRERLGYWQRGGPVGWSADPPVEDETLGILLVKSRHLTEAQRAESMELMERQGIRQGTALIQMGVLKREHLPAVLSRQCEFVLTRVLQEKAGRWAFFPLPELPGAFPGAPVGVVGLLLRAFVTHGAKLPLKQLLASLKKTQGRTIFLRDAAISALREMRYSREEASVFDALRIRPRTVTELLDNGPVPVEVGAPILWALIELGIVEQGKAETDDARVDRIGARIAAKKAKVLAGTWFDVLDLHWICLPDEVSAAARRLKEEFSAAATGSLPPALQGDLTLILTRIDEAAQALRDPAARRAYRKTLFSEADIARCVQLLHEQAEEARADDDEARAAGALARAQELTG